MEQRLLAEGRPERLAQHGPRYFSYESGRHGSLAGLRRSLRRHVTELRKGGTEISHPRTNDAVLKQTRRQFMESRPQLRKAWQAEVDALVGELDDINRLERAAAGDARRLRQLARRKRAVEARYESRMKWADGSVGKLKPDLVEVHPELRRIEVTDITQRPFDPAHNLKTRLYVEVLKDLFGWDDVVGLDYHRLSRQRPL